MPQFQLAGQIPKIVIRFVDKVFACVSPVFIVFCIVATGTSNRYLLEPLAEEELMQRLFRATQRKIRLR